MHVAVVGAGITGLTTAWQLTQAGHRVTLLDAAAGPAQGASAQNGAQLSYAFVAPLASPGTLKQLPQLLFDRDSPLRLTPAGVWQARHWCWQFVQACREAQVERTTRALLSLAALSRERFTHWRAGVASEAIDFAPNGKLVLYRSAASLDAAARQLVLQAAHGPSQRLLGAGECLAAEPALQADRAPLAGGVWTPGEEVADCAKVCLELERQLAATEGFDVRWSARASGWSLDGGRVRALRYRRPDDPHGLPHDVSADAYVVASGAAAPSLLRPLGVRLEVAPLKGYSIEVPAGHLQGMPNASITDSAAKVVFAPLGQGGQRRLRVAGMAELAGHDLRVDARRIAQLRDAVAGRFGLQPGGGDTLSLRPWAGLRPATPTGLPVIGRSATQQNVFVNAGQGALGFTLAFGSATLVAAELEGRPSPIQAAEHFRTGLGAGDQVA